MTTIRSVRRSGWAAASTVLLVPLYEALLPDAHSSLVNYAVHGVVGGSRNYLIRADLPGATSRLVERHY